MRTLLGALMAGALFSLPLTGTAHAAPGTSAVLTGNPLYKTGTIPQQTCEEPAFTSASHDGARLYVIEMSACLDRVWSAQVRKAGFTWTRPKVVVSHKDRVKTACGPYYPGDTFSLYCIGTGTIYLMVTDSALSNELNHPRMLESLAIGYSYHVQQLGGILREERRAEAKMSKKQRWALSAKVSLQNLCLTGAFLGSVWDSLSHTKAYGTDLIIDWKSVEGDHKEQGKAKNRVYWEQRGFDTLRPGACNTFTAPAGRVA
ncbi:neutral zinc metallopeptidase [Streptosporangium canum]|uniref:neutral zinc metallopeptidase n=1 Tax=Streptosporangium canum TaxID=324952 RepID=UPI003427367E